MPLSSLWTTAPAGVVEVVVVYIYIYSMLVCMYIYIYMYITKYSILVTVVYHVHISIYSSLWTTEPAGATLVILSICSIIVL